MASVETEYQAPVGTLSTKTIPISHVKLEFFFNHPN